jgi:hypothetical protein
MTLTRPARICRWPLPPGGLRKGRRPAFAPAAPRCCEAPPAPGAHRPLDGGDRGPGGSRGRFDRHRPSVLVPALDRDALFEDRTGFRHRTGNATCDRRRVIGGAGWCHDRRDHQRDDHDGSPPDHRPRIHLVVIVHRSDIHHSPPRGTFGGPHHPAGSPFHYLDERHGPRDADRPNDLADHVPAVDLAADHDPAAGHDPAVDLAADHDPAAGHDPAVDLAAVDLAAVDDPAVDDPADHDRADHLRPVDAPAVGTRPEHVRPDHLGGWCE